MNRTGTSASQQSPVEPTSPLENEISPYAHEIAQFEALYPFKLDEFQRVAIETLLAGDSVMVAAPTGTGKTILAEFGVWEAFQAHGTRYLHHAD